MLSLPAALVLEKNKLFQAGAFLELFEVQMADGSTVRRANNAEDVEWNGETWEKFAVQPGDFDESAEGDVPEVEIKVSNVGRVFQGYLETTTNGMIGDTLVYRVVHSDNLGEKTPAIEVEYEILDAVADGEWVRFTLGIENPFLLRFPSNVYRRNICRYKPWMRSVCSYVDSASCDRSFADCVTLGQTAFFGGQPGIPGGAWVAS